MYHFEMDMSGPQHPNLAGLLLRAMDGGTKEDGTRTIFLVETSTGERWPLLTLVGLAGKGAEVLACRAYREHPALLAEVNPAGFSSPEEAVAKWEKLKKEELT